MLSLPLFHLYLETADPASNKIVERRADDAENESHRGVDDWEENSHPKQETTDERSRRRLIRLGMLRKSAEHPGEGEEGEENQPHAAVNHGEHFSGLERRDSFNPASHRGPSVNCARPSGKDDPLRVSKDGV